MADPEKTPDSRLNRASGHLSRAQMFLDEADKLRKSSSRLRIYRPTTPSVLLERDSKGLLRVVKPQGSK